MKKVIVISGLVIVAGLGIFCLTNTKPTEKAAKTDPYEISLKQINQNIKSGALLIDVRTPEEFNKDHATGAINLPVEKIQKGELPNVAKDQIVYLYCHSGKRAATAKAILEKAGFSHALSLTSLHNWVSMGGQNTGTNPKCTKDNAVSC